ncbi:MAG TPA: hypothetical protein VFG30_02305 [Polyangiales bacterium]|jgi:hypothetical protein|nr:hypothetical protein [Polyangiales bacterium]
MVTISETGRDEPPKILADDEEDVHDGWGPIRPRRSSMPPDHPDASHEHVSIPRICAPEKKD